MDKLLPVILVFLFGLQGCMGSLDYVEVSGSDKAYIYEGRPVYVDKFKVNSKDYPAFRLAGDLLVPPVSKLCTFGGCIDIRQIKIEKEDVWHVTHIVTGRYLIQSYSYNERQCRYLDKKGYGDWFVNILNMCLRSYDFAIYITPDGEVSGGWELLPGHRKGGAERKVFFNMNPSKNTGWPDGEVFQQHN